MATLNKRKHVALGTVLLASASATAMTAHAAKGSAVVAPIVVDLGDALDNPLLPAPPSGALRPYSGDISAFSGNISAFSGNISAFSGNISAFYGNISAFSGTLDPFWGNISAFQSTLGAGTRNVVTPDFGKIGTFWGDNGPLLSSTYKSWSTITPKSSTTDLNALAKQFTTLQAKSETFWGAAVRSQTGQSFYDGFAKGLYAKYGFNPSDANSFKNVSDVQRGMFVLDWFDGLMNFTGTDHVDWWMKSVNWTPLLTQTQGGGADAKIGLLDFAIGKDTAPQGSLTVYNGSSNFSNGHGAAVASLMVAPHDGKGVMGMTPKATLLAYNPFDATGTANWDDITTGVATLASNGAGVVNASLGVPGWTLHPDWNKVFTSPKALLAVQKSVFVIAAGNDGITQTQNLNWSLTNPNVIVVGSVGPTDAISSFSNRPGNACLSAVPVLGNLLGTCALGSRLMDRFITAPGELLLVADEQGGTTRMVGTSFAAPLVSGAIALLQDRWPWLASKPTESANIILKSARDAGAPGVDPVYGVGILDVTASQAPLNFDTLKFYYIDKNSQLKEESNGKVRSMKEEDLEKLGAKGLFYYGYETIGSTYRDFAIPLSTKMVGQKVASLSGSQEYFQQYVYDRMTDWQAGGTGSLHEGGPGKGKGYRFTTDADAGVPLANPWGVKLTFAAKPWGSTAIGYRASGLPMQTDLKMLSADGKQALRFGYGDGASALTGLSGFALGTDSDSALGGANPVLGLASGGAYGKWTTALGKSFSFSAGATQKRARLDLNQLASPDRLAFKSLGDYRADAAYASLTWKAAPTLSLSSGVTRLDEAQSLLGVRSTAASDLAGGSSTLAGSVGAEWSPSDGLRLSASGTLGSTRTADGANFATGDTGLTSSAFAFALDKAGVIDGRDRARVSFSQPLTVEAGKLAYTSVQVVDRSTGRIGAVTQFVDAGTADRPYVAEFLYGHDVANGAGEWGLFGRMQTVSTYAGRTGGELMAGARFRISY